MPDPERLARAALHWRRGPRGVVVLTPDGTATRLSPGASLVWEVLDAPAAASEIARRCEQHHHEATDDTVGAVVDDMLESGLLVAG